MRGMLLSALLVVLLIALGASSFILESAKAGKPPTSPVINVTSTIEGLGINTSPTLRVQSDQLGSYQTITSGKTTLLQSVIQSLGDWELDMLNFTSSAQRKILIDLGDPVPTSGPNGSAPINPFGATGYQVVRARFISKCSEYGLNFLTMLPNTLYYCPLAIRFDDAAGIQYRLVQNPNNFAESNLVQVTCMTTDSASKCNQWKIEPSAMQLDGERKNVAQLLKLTTSRQNPETDQGDFYLSFTIHVTKP